MYFLLFLPLFISISSFASLRVCTDSSLNYLDPHQASGLVENEIAMGLVYETVVKYNPKNKELVPFLIKRWASLAEGKVYNLYFEKKINFISPSGVEKNYELSAEDYLFSLKLYLKKVKAKKIKDDYALLNIKNVTLIEPKVVSIELNRPDPFFMKNLAEKMGIVLSKKYYDDLDKSNKLSYFYKLPVGTGAYRYKKIDKKELTLYLQPNYHFGVPQTQEISFLSIFDSEKREKYLKSSLCEIAVDLDSDTFSQNLKLERNKNDTLLYFNVPQNSSLIPILKLRPLHHFLNFMPVSLAINKDATLADNLLSSKVTEDISHLDLSYKSSGVKKLFREKNIRKIKFYFDDDVKNKIHSIPKFLKLLKTSFHDLDVEITMGSKVDYDLALNLIDLNGFPEKSLKLYFPLWPLNGKFTKTWYDLLSNSLGKTTNAYPLCYLDNKIGVSPVVDKFYSFRSLTFDLTTVKLKDN